MFVAFIATLSENFGVFGDEINKVTMSQENKDKEKARNVRRAAKGALTRAINTGKIMLNAKRPATEMYATVKQVKDTYDNLGNKHDD